MPLTALLVAASAFLAAAIGGLVALRAIRHVGLIIAAGAGIRIGAAYFDLIPESVEHLGGSLDVAMLCTAFGFLAFYSIEKLTALHVGHETATELEHGDSAHRHVGFIGSVGMSLHSFLDGIGIVSMQLASRAPRSEIYRWVALVALAPVAGVIVGLLLPVPDMVLGGMLGVFAGFFLYIGAAELLPEAHRSDRSRWVVGATLAGVGAIYAFSIFAGAVGGH
ncbi:MAG: ZIP family metal transporter [Candidatus Limnocylindria bacterium]